MQQEKNMLLPNIIPYVDPHFLHCNMHFAKNTAFSLVEKSLSVSTRIKI